MIVGTYGDNFDRYAIRLNEVRESVRIVHQALGKMPRGDYRVQDKKVTPPPRARTDESMEALIHRFKLFTEGSHAPEGEVYAAVESPRGEIGWAARRRARTSPRIGPRYLRPSAQRVSPPPGPSARDPAASPRPTTHRQGRPPRH